jgi:3-oxoacyl-[acyl-carrier protein] reductase
MAAIVVRPARILLIEVTIVARHGAESKAAAEELGGDVSAAVADVTNLAELEEMAMSVARRNGGIDVLCANAGIFPQVRIEDMSPEQWDAVLATNLKD